MAEAAALVDGTRLRIPLLVAEDWIHGHSFWSGATIFPTQLGMAADLIRTCSGSGGARVTAVEVSATGIHWTSHRCCASPATCGGAG